jgi:hypothetical protein
MQEAQAPGRSNQNTGGAHQPESEGGKRNSKPSSLLTLKVMFCSEAKTNKETCILDSCAEAHVIPHATDFTEMEPAKMRFGGP